MYISSHLTRKTMKLGRPIVQIDKSTNKIVVSFHNSAIAMGATGIDASAINKCCLNRPKFKTAGGYIWKYADQPENKKPTQKSLFDL